MVDPVNAVVQLATLVPDLSAKLVQWKDDHDWNPKRLA